jgi:hypothetical protein
MRLKHMVKDKINYRARGPNTMLTRQPVQGRANDGGLRIGEMERDGVMGHGMSYFLNESFMIRGEKQEFYIAVCNKTGCIAIYNEARNLFLSPLVDGPIKFNVNPDGSQSIMNLSRFGRSFSILRVPYAFKLLIHELQVMNVQMRIITDENVDQLLSMSFSNNINKLTKVNNNNINDAIQKLNLQVRRGIDKAFDRPKRLPFESETSDTSESDVIDSNSESMSETTMPYNPIEFYGPESQEQMQQQQMPPHEIPTHQMTSQYQYVTDSPPSPSEVWQIQPQYDSNSPGYNPNTPPQMSSSPGYNPNTPPQMSSSPGYNPNTPPTPPNNANSTILEVAPPVPQEENASLNSSTENGEEQNKPIEQSSSGGNNSSEIKKIII